MAADGGEGDRKTESRRILDRIALEAESGGAARTGRMARRTRARVEAHDVDRGDWAEYWGTRIGRILGLVLTVGLIVGLVFFVLGGG